MKKVIVFLGVMALSLTANAYLLHWDDYKASVPAGTLTHDYINVDGSGIRHSC
jgi:hypothetical protein